MSGNVNMSLPVRYMRSAHLERDFYDPQALDNYVLTDLALAGVKRIASGVRPESGERAWRIIGDYGSGKSSFALLLAHWFVGNVKKLPSPLSKSLKYSAFKLKSLSYVPVLVTGAREPLALTIQRGVQTSVDYHYPNGLGRCKLATLLKKEGLSDSDVVSLLDLYNNRMVVDKKGKGLLLIIDELGKSLEYAASAVSENDVFLLQRLAEAASRSGDTPLFVIGVLHQGFSAYASSLGLEAKREWDKVAGRYDEIVFNHPLEQTAVLVADALGSITENISKKQVAFFESEMRCAVKAGWYGSTGNPEALFDLAFKLYPLAPSVLPVMARLLQRYGQNQRSVFSFLFGSEPFALRTFLETSGLTYRIYDLFDYVRSNLSHHLLSSYVTTNWAAIDSMVQECLNEEPLKQKIVKTIGMLNLLDDSDLTPNEETVCMCITGKKSDNAISQALKEMQSDHGKKVIYDRGRAGGLCLWSHLSVDLEMLQEEALASIGSIVNSADFIQTHSDRIDVVAKRHYIQTGNLRFFSVSFCDVAELESPEQLATRDSDGSIFVPLCMSLADAKRAEKMVRSSAWQAKKDAMVVIPKPLTGLSPFIREVQVWNWIRNANELNGDRFARETVSRKCEIANRELSKAITNVIGINDLSGRFDLKCYWAGSPLDILTGREFSAKISDICRDLFSSAPVIKNELLNRKMLSSAAAAARMRLIRRVLETPEKPLLGMDKDKKPPEMSMYMSVLQEGGLHTQDGEVCKMIVPSAKSDRLKLRPSFECLDKLLRENVDTSVDVTEIFERLERAPYGLRAGVIPLLIAVYYTIHKHNIAFFKDGTFLSEVSDADFMLLTKKPQLFKLQYCNVDGLRSKAFKRLASSLHISTESDSPPDLLDVVRPLCFIVAKLPFYSQKTKKLSKEALAVRSSILEAKDPLKLLFNSLPVDCGCQPVRSGDGNSKNAEAFVRKLPKIIDELQNAYAKLQERNKQALVISFKSTKKQEARFRSDIGKRADVLFSFVSDLKLKAFCFRLKDAILSEKDWLDSIASLVVSKPPEKWTDEDEQEYNQGVSELGGQFLRTEGIAFDSKGNTRNGALRICVTLPDGSEEKKVLAINKEDEKDISDLQCKIKELITKHGDVALVAASQAVWDELQGK